MPKSFSTHREVLARLHGNDPDILRMIEEERVNGDIAQAVYDARKAAGLTQAALAKLVGTGQPAIARLEDSDYAGHSVRMLQRIADALGCRLEVRLSKPKAHNVPTSS